MPKTLRKLTRPDRAQRGQTTKSPSANLQIIQLAGVMRTMVIGFCIVVLSLVWLLPNYMSLPNRLLVTVWFGGIGVGGLFVLHRVKRNAIRDKRRASGCCLECGYDLRGTPERCPECGAVRRAG